MCPLRARTKTISRSTSFHFHLAELDFNSHIQLIAHCRRGGHYYSTFVTARQIKLRAISFAAQNSKKKKKNVTLFITLSQCFFFFNFSVNRFAVANFFCPAACQFFFLHQHARLAEIVTSYC